MYNIPTVSYYILYPLLPQSTPFSKANTGDECYSVFKYNAADDDIEDPYAEGIESTFGWVELTLENRLLAL